MPGYAASGQLTPTGNLSTGWAQYTLRFGRRLRAWNQPTRTLPDPSVPLMLARLRDGRVRYTQEVFAVPVPGMGPVAYLTVTAKNRGRTAARARAAMRVVHTHGRTVRSSMKGRRLRPGGRVSWTWKVPLDPSPAGQAANAALDALSRRAARAQLRRQWAEQQRGMMTIQVPERKISDTYRASIVQMLQSRYKTPSGYWVQAVNRLQYQAFWLRDAAIMTQALDLAGLRHATAENLQFLRRWQRHDGLFISRNGQYDGLGQALWVLAEHARLTGSQSACTAHLDRLDKAIHWLDRHAKDDPLGLLPPGDPRDNELAAGHITGDNLWAAAGLRAAIACAKEAGHDSQAARWQEVDTRFEEALRAALARAVARAGHIPPVLDKRGGQDWGNYWAAYPVAVLDPTDPWVTATRRWAHRHFAEGLATYRDGRNLHAYLGFRILETDLAAGDPQAALRGLYAAAAHTTATDGGWETSVKVYGNRRTRQNLAPHGTFSGEYVALLRNLLVRETADGGVTLAAGAGPAWLAPGRRIVVTDAPVGGGAVVSYTLTGRRGGAVLQWRSTLPPGTPLSWTLPWWAKRARTADGPAGPRVALTGPEGTVAVTWSGAPPKLSYARTKARLARAYRARGKRPPYT